MKRLLLMCMGGFSTGILVDKMKAAAKDGNIEVVIDAISTNELDNVIGDYDCLLLAPQVSYLESDIKGRYKDLPIYLIQPTDYGRLRGDKILKGALELLS